MIVNMGVLYFIRQHLYLLTSPVSIIYVGQAGLLRIIRHITNYYLSQLPIMKIDIPLMLVSPLV
jgi:hypothetical protein